MRDTIDCMNIQRRLWYLEKKFHRVNEEIRIDLSSPALTYEFISNFRKQHARLPLINILFDVSLQHECFS